MSRSSPTVEGFRATFRLRSLTFAEIIWRWIVGSIGWALFLFSLFEYLNTLPVTRGDRTLLGSGQPLLIGKAISHIFHGSLNRVVFTALVAALALALIWIVAASIGRIATIRTLLARFENSNSFISVEPSSFSAFRALLGLNSLRVASTLAALLAFLGAAILVSFASRPAHPHPGLAFVLFLPFAAAICIAWPILNWFLSLASIFAIRDSADTLTAFSAAVTFFRERLGPVLAVSTWTGLGHLVAFSAFGTAVSFPLAFSQIAPQRLVLAVILVCMLAYFAVVDWLYIARLAGYIFILEMPEPAPEPSAAPTSPASGSTLQTTIDRDEPILSDLPNLAVET